MRQLVWVLLATLAGCTSSKTPAAESKQVQPPTTPKSDGPSPAPADEGNERWRCDANEDCVQTCALGAVNKDWLQAHPDADSCDSGCAEQIGGETCQRGECVTLNDDGSIHEGCTRNRSVD